MKEERRIESLPRAVPESFFILAEKEIERLKGARSSSTLSNYHCALHSFHRYLQYHVGMSEIDVSMLEGYEHWLREGRVSLNTISCYMRSLRSIMTRLQGAKACQLFTQIYTGQAKTEKRSISIEDVVRFKNVRLRAGSFCSLVRDVFLFSFYSCGMPFIDIAFLRKSQITNTHLTYYRHKTGQRVIVRLEPCMEEIIHRYQRQDRNYVFPLIRSENADSAYKEYLIMLNRFNRTLKIIARKAGIEGRLTSYTPRHTWASVAFNANIDLPVISKALGHTNPQTTLTYIKELSDERLSEANQEILKRFI